MCVSLIIAFCRVLESPLNGRLALTNNFEVGSMATYFCNKGYRIIGKFQRICTSNRTWTEVIPTCLSGKKRNLCSNSIHCKLQ